MATCLVGAVAFGSAVRAGAAPMLSLTHAGRWLTDAQGRGVSLHGFNLFAGGPGANVPGDPETAFGFDQDDAAFLSSEGFTAMRIGILPHDIEPRPGVYDDAYIRKFVDLGALLARYRIYMLLYFVQVDYGPLTYGAGLPAWGTLLTDGTPNPNLGYAPGHVGDPAMERAFDNLYANAPGPGGVGIADRLAAAEGHVADAASTRC